LKEEIFGPILPILTYDDSSELIPFIKRFEKPLAFYIFSENKNFTNHLIHEISAGGVCVNDTIIQLVNHRLPFGGVGMSGMGAYHGKHTFLTFSHQKSVVKRATWLDIPVKYAPYAKKLKWIRMLMKRM
jgi:aldehyde dehydrogenase (NAD+)